MRFYTFTDIEAAGSCIRFVRECLCQEVNKENRCVATWRGGKNFNVALTDRGWYDHKMKEKGGIIKLCAMSKFNGNIQQAQEFLGDWLGLTPTNTTIRLTYDYRKQNQRYLGFIQDGYHEVKKYVYLDANGNDLHYVIRMEHPTKHKEFVQCTPYSGSLKGVDTVLYNLPVIANSDWVIVVEGEKDADTLINLGLPATTCNCGSDHWRDSYTEALRGKDVVICRDNDEAGNDHAHLLLRSLASAAKSLRVVCPSKLPKGDVTDWMLQEGGSLKKFYALMQKAPNITPEEAMWNDEEYALYRAKKANERAFSNYALEAKLNPNNKREKFVEMPRTPMEMIEDAHVRFLGFPRRLGKNTMFDHDRDTNKIEILSNDASVFSWMGEKSKHPVMWKPGVGFATKGEFYHALLRNAICYEKISEVPNYPMRPDVYYTFRNELKPSKDHAALAKFMTFFNPEDEVSLVLMMTMLASMMYYKPGIQRPCWIIDSKGGQAAGKTTFAELACYLYKCTPIKTNIQELTHDAKELNKRLVSVTGRNSLMLLVDNVRGVFDNAFFADLVTGFNISGKAPYGIGEESRPNDLTYVITSNSANIGSDMASRSFIFYIAPPRNRVKDWKATVMAYIDKHRYEILGDIYDILANTPTPENFTAKTRVPEFEAEVLFKMSGTKERYEQVIESVLTNRADANVDAERAILAVENIKDCIKKSLENCNDPDNYCVFLRNAVVNYCVRILNGIDIQDIRNMVNTGKIDCIDPKIKRYPRTHSSALIASGILFIGSHVSVFGNTVKVPILTMSSEKSVKVAGYVEDELLVKVVQERQAAAEARAANDGNPFIEGEAREIADTSSETAEVGDF